MSSNAPFYQQSSSARSRPVARPPPPPPPGSAPGRGAKYGNASSYYNSNRSSGLPNTTSAGGASLYNTGPPPPPVPRSNNVPFSTSSTKSAGISTSMNIKSKPTTFYSASPAPLAPKTNTHPDLPSSDAAAAAAAAAAASSGDDWFKEAESSQPTSTARFGSSSSLESQNKSHSSTFYPSNTTNTTNNESASANFMKPVHNNSINMTSSTNSDISNLSGPMTTNPNQSSSSMTSNYVYNPDDFSNEPPLMEELGINIPHILLKSRAVILPSSRFFNTHIDAATIMDDDDPFGPLVFALLLGGELLLTAKIYLGYIYGFFMFGCFTMALMLNLMCPPDQKSIPVWTVWSILGYSLLPVNVLAFLNIFFRVKQFGKIGIIFGILTVLWCTVSSTRLFERGCGMSDQRYLVAYPTALLYSCFVIITIF